MKIGVFDSGIGGKAVAQSLERAFSSAKLLVVNDKAHVPYGTRSSEEIIRLTDDAIQPLLGAECDVIVLACNTATAAAIDILRIRYPHQQFIGLEPMLKTAARQTESGVICMCATPSTLTSERYMRLKQTYARDIIVLEPDCSDWASMIERGAVEEKTIHDIINTACDSGADTIVLACTHYHWIRNEIEKAASGRAAVIDPSKAIIGRVKSILELR